MDYPRSEGLRDPVTDPVRDPERPHPPPRGNHRADPDDAQPSHYLRTGHLQNATSSEPKSEG